TMARLMRRFAAPNAIGNCYRSSHKQNLIPRRLLCSAGRIRTVCNVSALPPQAVVGLDIPKPRLSATTGPEQSQQGSHLFDHLVGATGAACDPQIVQLIAHATERPPIRAA